MQCVCGSTTHFRITHTDCRFNPKNTLNYGFTSSPTTSILSEVSNLSVNSPNKRKKIGLTNKISKKLFIPDSRVILT
jgi:hypothetical protein